MRHWLLLLCIYSSLVFSSRGEAQGVDTSTLAEITVVAAQVKPAATLQTLPIQTVRLLTSARTAFAQESILPAVNHYPGVRMEQRAPGSYRLVLRGTSRRSPFGVRGTRVYWNGLPLTEPGGDTPLNFLNLENIDEVELVKGPNASLYTGELGGLVLLSTSPENKLAAPTEDHEQASYQIGLQAGSFRSLGLHARYTQKRSKHQDAHLDLRLAHNQTAGYRAHSALRRTTAQVSLLDSNWLGNTAVYVLATSLEYDLPGALTPEQFAENPTQARPGSAESNASIDYEAILAGARFERRLPGGFLLLGMGYLSGFRFDNPFNINHKRETNHGTGGRMLLRKYLPLPGVVSLKAGTEVQVESRNARQYTPNGGKPGELQFIDDISSSYLAGFTELTGDHREWNYTLGLRIERSNFIVDRTFDENGLRGQTQSGYKPQFLPRIAVGYRPMGATNLLLQASLGVGNSAPTLREFRTNEGSLNTALLPERGRSIEIGATYQNQHFAFILAGYLTRLTQTITTFQDSSEIQLFRNAGETEQPGLEIQLNNRGKRWSSAQRFTAAASYTYAPYRYRDYQVNGQDFSKNLMPGIPTHTADLLASWRLAKVFQQEAPLSLNTNFRYESTIPLNDQGSVLAAEVFLVRASLGIDFRHLQLQISGDNLLNTVYSRGNDLNPQFGRRYFQPAPPRNINLAFSWTW